MSRTSTNDSVLKIRKFEKLTCQESKKELLVEVERISNIGAKVRKPARSSYIDN